MNSYLIIKVYGKNINRFLYRCKDNKINILNISTISHKEVIIKINQKDYEKLVNIKSFYDLTIIRSSGFLKFKEMINKNKIFIVSSIIGIVFLIFLSNIIFTIEIISDNSNLNNKIMKELNNNGIKKYSIKKTYYEIEKIKNKIKEKYKDYVEWIEITNIGTKYEVNIVERKKNNLEENNEFTNIVAKKSGIVKKIYAENGQKQVEINTYVNKGDIIISGSIMKGEETKEYVHAKGKVYAEIWYDVNIEFPLNYTEKKYTNNTSKNFYIKINDKYYGIDKYKNFERKNILSLKNRLIPFEIGIQIQREVKIINDKYSISIAKKKAIDKAKEKILQKLDKDEYILEEKVLNFSKNSSTIKLDMFFVCFEEISKEEKISVIEE